MTEHQIRPGVFAKRGGRQGLQARCTCGWQSVRIALTERQSWADSRAHVRGAELDAAQREAATTKPQSRTDEVGTPTLLGFRP